jgi:hypothetical protein
MSVYGEPLVYWTAAVLGLVIALLSDGWGDVLGLALLCTPLLRLLDSGVRRRAG